MSTERNSRYFVVMFILCIVPVVFQWCSGTKTISTTTTPPEAVDKYFFPSIPDISSVNEDNLEQVFRRFMDINPHSSFMKELRKDVARVVYERFNRMFNDGDFQGGYEIFSKLVSTFSPEDILSGELGTEVEQMAWEIVNRFSPMGDEARVLTALTVLRGIHPDDKEVEKKYNMVSKWIEEARQGLGSKIEKFIQIVEIYENVFEITPVPSVTSKLIEVYDKRFDCFTDIVKNYKFGGMDFGSFYTEYYYLNVAIERTSHDILKVYTRIGRPTDGLAKIESYRGTRGFEPEIANILEKLKSNPGAPELYLKLSKMFLKTEFREGMWACFEGWKHSPMDYRFPMCVAMWYQRIGDSEGAEEYLNVAKSLNESEPEIYTQLMKLYLKMIDESQEDEQNEVALDYLDRLQKVYTSFKSRWKSRQAPVDIYSIKKKRGIIEFYMGLVDKAIEDMKESGYNSNDVESLILLSSIYLARGWISDAIDVLNDALSIRMDSQIKSKYYKVKIYKKLGDAYRFKKEPNRAKHFYTLALELLRQLLPYISLDFVEELHAIEGEINYRLGRKDEALKSFKAAVSISSEGYSYAEILSFLTGAGDIELFSSLYRLAYTDSSVARKWKIYFSLWYMVLQKFRKDFRDETARQFLMNTQGDGWVETLAMFYSGRTSYEDAHKRAGKKNRLVELTFYNAFNFAEKDERSRFVKLLRDTVEFQYYGLYETVIAIEILNLLGKY